MEQFIVCEPEASPAELDAMVANSREFYESLGIPYRLVNIVSGGLNNAAAIKYDLRLGSLTRESTRNWSLALTVPITVSPKINQVKKS